MGINMLSGVFSSIFGTKHGRQIKRFYPIVDAINSQWQKYSTTLSDADFPKLTEEFQQRLKDGETLDDLLPEAFALVKDACRRLVGKKWEVVGNITEWDMVPYDVQLIGGIALHEGMIAEMATGEGKTLVATMPLYLNSLGNKGVHLITVNDYLARRDMEWMGGVYEFLGRSIGCITGQMPPDKRKESYNCDITYGTNNEFGFDYLRDNMSTHPDYIVQRGHNYCIVDEVDSVLIDEARTPLIIAGPVRKSNQLYDKLKPSVQNLVKIQRDRVNEIIKKAEDLLKADSDEDNFEAGRMVLKAYHATPKNKKLTKLLSETGVKSMMRQVENIYLRDKTLHELDEELLYVIDEKQHTIDLTEEGRELLARYEGGDSDLFLLPDLAEESHTIESTEEYSSEEKARLKDELQVIYSVRSERIHNITQLLRAYSLYEKDIEYVVQDGKVNIVDEFTGRLMTGRRYSDGLHQAIEAKEGVKVEGETQTVATITLQNYFRLYDKLAGMTGTAETEEAEFWDIYKLEVMVIPTNEDVRRADHDDVIFRTKKEKYETIIQEIGELHDDGLPVLVGTTSVEVSEMLYRLLRRKGITPQVLNAKQHQGEAEIIKYAGQTGSVTIATNMAGRGTDIKLGKGIVRWKGKQGDKDKAEGGLQIIGTERHESRRIDRQLRGRAGRQGDPGASIFYLSLEDDLMRLFGSERITKVMDRLGLKEGEVIAHPMITKSIEKAQKRVESYNFSIRKHLLEYDNVMNQQRDVVYGRRRSILFDEDIRNVIDEIASEYLDNLLDATTEPGSAPSFWDQDQLRFQLQRNLRINPPSEDRWDILSKPDDWHKYLLEKTIDTFINRRKLYNEEQFDRFVREIALRTIDEKWKDHLYDMDRLKEGVGLRAYGQKDPLIEYKREGYELFSMMLDTTNEETLRTIFNHPFLEQRARQGIRDQRFDFVHASPISSYEGVPPGGDGNSGRPPAGGSMKRQPVRVTQTVGRNAPCPCGSGKKYKKCHGA